MRRLEVRPDRRKWVAEVPQQIRENLPYGLWFPRELGQIVSVVDGALAEALARMADACAVVADDRDGARTDMHDQITPGPATRHRVVRAVQPHEGPRAHRRDRRRLGGKRRRDWPPRVLLFDEAARDRRRRAQWRIEAREQRDVDRVERRVGRNRHQGLTTQRLAARFNTALVVPLAGPTEAGLEEVMRGERRKARRQRPRTADEDPH